MEITVQSLWIMIPDVISLNHSKPKVKKASLIFRFDSFFIILLLFAFFGSLSISYELLNFHELWSYNMLANGLVVIQKYISSILRANQDMNSHSTWEKEIQYHVVFYFAIIKIADQHQGLFFGVWPLTKIDASMIELWSASAVYGLCTLFSLHHHKQPIVLPILLRLGASVISCYLHLTILSCKIMLVLEETRWQ